MVLSFLVSVLVVTGMLLLPHEAAGETKEVTSRGKGCLRCHEGIEVINTKMADEWGADRRCEVCHDGQPAAVSELEAHAGLIRNPGDLRVVTHTCGQCHSVHGEIENLEIRGIGDHVGRVMRSLMATAAGEIAGTRYLWNEQKTRTALYGIRPVSDTDYNQPPGAVQRLQHLPPATNSDVDSLLRGACLRCHLWTEDKTTAGVFRPGGCSACHVLYSEDGLSRSGDPTISTTEPGHPEQHTITTKIPDAQCRWCHNDGGARIGLSYAGLAVTRSALERSAPVAGGKTAYGATVMHIKPDVHHRRGIACIDCHDTVDLHGDGNIYSHQEYQVGIRCETCHGTAAEAPTFQTEHGRKLRNIEREGKTSYLRTKLFMEKHPIPVLFSDTPESSSSDDIWHDGHLRLECYTCHSTTVPQCYCCHMVRNDAHPSPIDWGLGVGEGETVRSSIGAWEGQKLFQLWDDAALGVNWKDRVTPLVPGGQTILSHRSAEGKLLKENHTFTTAGGLYGFSMNPVQPHTVSTESRACSSCHSSRKALGLGTDFIDLKRLGLQLGFSPDSIVDEGGVRLQDSGHDGARPFNRAELQGLLRSEVCINCHSTSTKTRVEVPLTPMSLKAADEAHHRAVRDRIEPEKE